MGLSKEDFYDLTVHSRIYGFGEMNSPRIHKVELRGIVKTVWISWPENGQPRELIWDDKKDRIAPVVGPSNFLIERLSSDEKVMVFERNADQLIRELVDSGELKEEIAKLLEEAVSVSRREAMEGVMFV